MREILEYRILIKPELSRNICEKSSNIEFYTNPSSGRVHRRIYSSFTQIVRTRLKTGQPPSTRSKHVIKQHRSSCWLDSKSLALAYPPVRVMVSLRVQQCAQAQEWLTDRGMRLALSASLLPQLELWLGLFCWLDDYSLVLKWHAGTTTSACARWAAPQCFAGISSGPLATDLAHRPAAVLYHVPSAA